VEPGELGLDLLGPDRALRGPRLDQASNPERETSRNRATQRPCGCSSQRASVRTLLVQINRPATDEAACLTTTGLKHLEQFRFSVPFQELTYFVGYTSPASFRPSVGRRLAQGLLSDGVRHSPSRRQDPALPKSVVSASPRSITTLPRPPWCTRRTPHTTGTLSENQPGLALIGAVPSSPVMLAHLLSFGVQT
jgi:hypothetical protein